MTSPDYRKLIKTAKIIIDKHREKTTKIMVEHDHRLVQKLRKILKEKKNE